MNDSTTEWPPLQIPRRVVTGCEALDAVLGGGFKIGHVTEVCGECGTGKTILCMQAAIADRYYLINQGIPSMAIYITSNCTFSVTRLADICKRFYGEGAIRSAMENVWILNADSHDEWSDVLNRLKGFLDGQQSQPKKTRVIVLDSISALYSYASRSTAELLEHTNRVTSTGYALQRFARDYNLAILVCNNVVNAYDLACDRNFTTSGRLVRPAVGKPWEKKLASRVLLTWERNTAGTEWTRQICQVKGDDANSGKCQFYVTEVGVTN